MLTLIQRLGAVLVATALTGAVAQAAHAATLPGGPPLVSPSAVTPALIAAPALPSVLPALPGACASSSATNGQSATAGTAAQVCSSGLTFVGPAIGQLAAVIGPTIIGPAVVTNLNVSAGDGNAG